MYLSSMNNIHIIHGIQYLQNTKYNTSCLCDLSSLCWMLRHGKLPLPYPFPLVQRCRGNLCLIHTADWSLGLHFEERFQVHCHQLPALAGIFSGTSHPVTRRLWEDTRGRWVAELGSSVIFLLAPFC